MKKTNVHSLIGQAGFGLTAASVISSYCLCLCAVLNQSVFVALICTLLFTMTSIGKNHIYAPSPLLAVVFFFLLQFNSFIGALVSLVAGSIVCLALSRFTKDKKLPDYIAGGCLIGLALCSTILFTNAYFGIGAQGFTPLEMLKSYRSLGFHPDFRGLLYGTITLFTMITYPFKFRKAKNIIPAEFITVIIPFVLNLVLNPIPAYTSTNEYSAVDFYDGMSAVTDAHSVLSLIGTSIATGFILFILSQNPAEDKALFKLLTVHPVIPCNSTEFSGIAPVVAIIVSLGVITLFPSVICRLPLPCAGSMLIVSAWQHTSFKPLSATFKEKNVIKFLLLILCTASFVALPAFLAVVLCLVLWLFTELIDHRRGAKP